MKAKLRKCALAVLCVLSSFFLVTSSLTVKAADSLNRVEYDMDIGGKQTFTLYDNEQNVLYVTIAEEQERERLANRTYTISFNSPLAWQAGYKVDVVNNSISSVHSAWHKAVTGMISTGRLTKESSKQATYYMTYHILAVITYPGVRTTISGTVMNVFAV